MENLMGYEFQSIQKKAVYNHTQPAITWRRFGDFIVSFEYISYLIWVFRLSW